MQHRAFQSTKTNAMEHMCAPVATARSDHSVFFVTETVRHVCSVYPNTVAASLFWAVRTVHFFDADAGCASLPDALSHDAWLYPSNIAACLWFNCVVVTARAVKSKCGGGSCSGNACVNEHIQDFVSEMPVQPVEHDRCKPRIRINQN